MIPLSKPKRWCGGWGYTISTADPTVWDVPTIRIECRGCTACDAYRIELDGNEYIVTRLPKDCTTILKRFTHSAEAEEWVRRQVAGRFP